MGRTRRTLAAVAVIALIVMAIPAEAYALRIEGTVDTFSDPSGILGRVSLVNQVLTEALEISDEPGETFTHL